MENKIYRFDEFKLSENTLNEGIVDSLISVIPSIKNKLKDIKKVAIDVKDKVKDILSKMPKEELNKLKRISPSMVVESKDKKSPLKKIISMFGLSMSVSGLLTAIISAIVTSASNYGFKPDTYFIAAVIMFVVGGFMTDSDTFNKKQE